MCAEIEGEREKREEKRERERKKNHLLYTGSRSAVIFCNSNYTAHLYTMAGCLRRLCAMLSGGYVGGKVGEADEESGGLYAGVSQREDAWETDDWDEGWPEEDEEGIDVFGQVSPTGDGAASAAIATKHFRIGAADDELSDVDQEVEAGGVELASISNEKRKGLRGGPGVDVKENFRMLDAMLPASTSSKKMPSISSTSPTPATNIVTKAKSKSQNAAAEPENAEEDLFATLGIVPDVKFSKGAASHSPPPPAIIKPPPKSPALSGKEDEGKAQSSSSNLLAFIDDEDEDIAGSDGDWGGDDLDFGDEDE